MSVSATLLADHPSRHLPTLPRTERDRRWRLVREAMASAGVDALVVWANDAFYGSGTANLRYLTQVGSQNGGVCVFPLQGEPVLYQSPPHMNVPFNFYAVAYDWVGDVRPLAGARSVVDGLRELGLASANLGLVSAGNAIVPDTMFHAPVVALEAALPGARLSEQSALVEGARVVKSREELELIEEAATVARQVVLRLYEAAAPGVREYELNAAMTHEQLRLGADPQTFNLLTSGPVDAPPGIWHLLHGVETLTRRPLARGDLVLTEFHVGVAGYLAAVEFSLFLGDPPPQLRRLHEVSVETLAAYEEALRPGVTIAEALAAVRAPAEAAGLDYLELGFHGHGLGSPEWPTVVYPPGGGPLDGAGLDGVELREGMVFGTNIDLHDPAWRADVGLMFGDTVAVTPAGGRLLVGTPSDLFAKP